MLRVCTLISTLLPFSIFPGAVYVRMRNMLISVSRSNIYLRLKGIELIELSIENHKLSIFNFYTLQDQKFNVKISW